jgi:hypothetical protein
MTEHIQTPLIGPLRRRGWREIVRVHPLSNIPHVALVVTRQGRLASVIPANGRRVLSDYITWPYDFREVDMRERLLLVRRRVESCDAGYEFDATLKLTYQVERPERVALELEDALTELEDALAQSLRVTSRAFGVEQAAALEENLREAVLYGDVLRERLEALGLGLRRADVAVELDERARARTEALREHMRERPLLAHLAIESLEPAISFDVLVSGGYRLTSRTLTIVPPEALDAALQEAIARTLRRVGIMFAPQDYSAAARTMAEALRHDALLQAQLSTAEIELVRPTVRIQPERHMVVAAQSAGPALPVPDSTDRARRAVPLLTGPVGPSDEIGDSPPWAALGAMFGREAPRALPAPPVPPAPAASATAAIVDVQSAGEAELRAPIGEEGTEDSSGFEPREQPVAEALWREPEAAEVDAVEDLVVDAPDEQTDDAWRTPALEMSPAGAEEEPGPKPLDEPAAKADILDPAADRVLPGENADLDQADDLSPGWLAPLAENEAHSAIELETPHWVALGAAFGRAEPTTDDRRPDQRIEVAEAMLTAQPNEPPIDGERIAQWIALLQADDPALFKLWSMELIARPAALPTILSVLASDPAEMDASDDRRYQRALADALVVLSEPPPYLAAAAHSNVEAVAAHENAPDDEPAPDWLSLRRSGREEVRHD